MQNDTTILRKENLQKYGFVFNVLIYRNRKAFNKNIKVVTKCTGTII